MGIWTPGPGPTAGNDQFIGDGAVDDVDGGAGNDILIGGAGADTLSGGDGQDILAGGQFAVVSSNGAYYLIAAGTPPSADVFDGGAGVDTLYVNYLNQAGGFTVDISNAAAVAAITRDGQAFGSVTGIEVLNAVGGLGADHFVAGSGSSTLVGDSGDDILAGGAGNDLLQGGSGDDLLVASAGQDILQGGAGIDTAVFPGTRAQFVIAEPGGTLLVGGNYNGAQGTTALSGVEYLQFSDQTITVRAATTQVGGSSADALTGTASGDFLSGAGGDDTLDGGEGDDWLSGGDGADTITGGVGADEISGGAGDDTLYGVAGTAGNAGDTIFGGDGADHIDGGSAYSTLDGEAGNDVIVGQGLLRGGLGNDSLTDSGLVPFLSPTYLDGGEGDDSMTAAGSTAIVTYQNAMAGVTVNLGAAGAQNTFGAGVDTLINVSNLWGSGWDDVLSGNADANLLRAFAGDDHLFGQGGDDILMGGVGDDTLDGGDGSDTADYSDANQPITVDLSLVGAQLINAESGSDTLISIENITATGSGNILMGNSAGNVLTGAAVGIGRGGDDTITGGIAVFSGGRASYNIATDDQTGVATVTDLRPGSPEGVDTLRVGQLLFTDAVVDIFPGAYVVLTPSTGGVDFDWDLAAFATAAVTGSDPVQVVLSIGGLNPTTVTLGGYFTAFDGTGRPMAGAITSITITRGQAPVEIHGIGILVSEWNAFLSANDLAGLQNQLFAGNDEIETPREFKLTAPHTIFGFGGDDILRGSHSGGDVFYGGPGDDIIDGNGGVDRASYAFAPQAVTVDLRIGGPQATGEGADTLIAIADLVGSPFNDFLTGNASANTLDGGQGSDSLLGLGGDDVLIGGGRANGAPDYLYGGSGNDTYYVTSTTASVLDVVFEGTLFAGSEAGVGDIDIVHSQGNFFWDYYSVGETLYIDNAVGGAASLIGGKDVLNKQIFGSSGTDYITTYGHNSIVDAGAGTDAISFNLYGLDQSYRGSNTVVMRPGSGTDYVYDFLSGTDHIDLRSFNFGITGAQVLAQAVDVDNPGTANDYCYVYLTSAGGIQNFIVFIGLLGSQLQAGDFVT